MARNSMIRGQCPRAPVRQGTMTSLPVAWLFSMYRWAATMSSRPKTRSTLGPVDAGLDLVDDPLQHGRARAALEVVAVESREPGSGRDHRYRLEVRDHPPAERARHAHRPAPADQVQRVHRRARPDEIQDVVRALGPDRVHAAPPATRRRRRVRGRRPPRSTRRSCPAAGSWPRSRPRGRTRSPRPPSPPTRSRRGSATAPGHPARPQRVQRALRGQVRLRQRGQDVPRQRGA